MSQNELKEALPRLFAGINEPFKGDKGTTPKRILMRNVQLLLNCHNLKGNYYCFVEPRMLESVGGRSRNPPCHPAAVRTASRGTS